MFIVRLARSYISLRRTKRAGRALQRLPPHSFPWSKRSVSETIPLLRPRREEIARPTHLGVRATLGAIRSFDTDSWQCCARNKSVCIMRAEARRVVPLIIPNRTARRSATTRLDGVERERRKICLNRTLCPMNLDNARRRLFSYNREFSISLIVSQRSRQDERTHGACETSEERPTDRPSDLVRFDTPSATYLL